MHELFAWYKMDIISQDWIQYESITRQKLWPWTLAVRGLVAKPRQGSPRPTVWKRKPGQQTSTVNSMNFAGTVSGCHLLSGMDWIFTYSNNLLRRIAWRVIASIHADWNISLFILSFRFIHHTPLTSCDILLSSFVLWHESGLAASEVPFRAALLCRIAVSWRYSVAHASTCTCACMLTLCTRECLGRRIADLHGAKCIARKQRRVLQNTKTDNAKHACSLLNISRTQWAVPCCKNLSAPSLGKLSPFKTCSFRNYARINLNKSSILTFSDLSIHVDTIADSANAFSAHAEVTL